MGHKLFGMFCYIRMTACWILCKGLILVFIVEKKNKPKCSIMNLGLLHKVKALFYMETSFRHWIKIIKGNCIFSSHNADFFSCNHSLDFVSHSSDWWDINSELQYVNLVLRENKTEFWVCFWKFYVFFFLEFWEILCFVFCIKNKNKIPNSFFHAVVR